MPYPISPEVGVDPLRQRLTHNAHASETPGVVRTHGFAGASVAHPRRLGAFRLLSSSGLRAETNEEETVNFTRQATSEKGKVGAEQGAEDTSRPLAPLASFARARNGG